jgi:AraC family transcriptional regulator
MLTEKVLYRAQVKATAGRDAHAVSSDRVDESQPSSIRSTENRMNFLEDIPAAVPSLIDAAVAAFDADRDTSRRYLLRASALLRVKCGARADPGGARPSEYRGGLLAWQLNRVVDYIETHLAQKVMVTDLADLIDVSVGQLIRAFKVSVGVPPCHYIASRRVELACTMMSTTREPLSHIAIACGLCDQAHLCKVFRRMIGMSPSAWRREQEMSGVDNMSLGMAAPDRGLQGAGPRMERRRGLSALQI